LLQCFIIFSYTVNNGGDRSVVSTLELGLATMAYRVSVEASFGKTASLDPLLGNLHYKYLPKLDVSCRGLLLAAIKGGTAQLRNSQVNPPKKTYSENTNC
jgi:hypothetical protein